MIVRSVAMIVGKQILDLGLVTGGSEKNLKNSTYDLTVGEIVPIGKAAINKRQKRPTDSYFLEPREMVWVLSKEDFNVPETVTGLATLRTTFTKQGILALNVGIIDPFFQGPISTALINFSDRPRRISIGDKFFRVAFFEHNDVTDYHTETENVSRDEYIKHLETVSYADFSRSFLNIPNFDNDYYSRQFYSVIFYGMTKNWKRTGFLLFVLIVVGWYLLETGLWDFYLAKLNLLLEHIAALTGKK
jgi:deoxycytidine triphosphate deaminase